MTHSHVTAPTQFVEAAGVRYAYRRFGPAEGVPLLFLQHFTGTMDFWDPAVVDGFARERTVVLFDNAGVGRSGGATPETVHTMADDAAAFIAALGLTQVDLLGFSLEASSRRFWPAATRTSFAASSLRVPARRAARASSICRRSSPKGSRPLRQSRGYFSSSIGQTAANAPAARSSPVSNGVRASGIRTALSRPSRRNSRRSSAGALPPPQKPPFGFSTFRSQYWS